MTTRILHMESANLDLTKSLIELKKEYQVKLKLENTAQGSLKLRIFQDVHFLQLKALKILSASISTP